MSKQPSALGVPSKHSSTATGAAVVCGVRLIMSSFECLQVLPANAGVSMTRHAVCPPGCPPLFSPQPRTCSPTQSILDTWSSTCGISSLAAPLTRAVATCCVGVMRSCGAVSGDEGCVMQECKNVHGWQRRGDSCCSNKLFQWRRQKIGVRCTPTGDFWYVRFAMPKSVSPLPSSNGQQKAAAAAASAARHVSLPLAYAKGRRHGCAQLAIAARLIENEIYSSAEAAATRTRLQKFARAVRSSPVSARQPKNALEKCSFRRARQLED